ncbi:hypothetical protein EDD21DRAFT_375937 [Dissophora ornata]|nr:hypothetical protein EDD21DRAFT_375937 [Dissophora ornata]
MVRKVSKRCKSADEFRSSALIQPGTLIYAIRHLRNLTWMDLKDSQDLTDSVFDALSCTVHSLSFIRLPGSKMKNVSTRAVTSMILAQNKNTLSQFKVIHGTNIFEDDSILKAIGERHGCSMQRLTLAICDLEHSGLQEYGPLCTELISLNLEYTSGVTDDVLLPILETCRQLVKLDLTETDCTQATILALSTSLDSTNPQQGRFSSLKRLILNNIDSPFTTNLFLPMADACPDLEELHMNSILADSFQDFSQFIAKTKQLKDLDIGNVFPEFSDSNLSSLVDTLPSLRWLSIANTQITDVSLVYLAENAHNLCDLCILGCDQVTKTGLLDFLDKITNKAGFRRLDITYCRLDDGAVAEIRERAKSMSVDDAVNGAIEVEGDDQFADSLTEDEGEREDGEDDIVGDDEDIEAAVETTEMEEASELVSEENVFDSSDNSEDDDDDLQGGYNSDFAEVLAHEEEEMSDFSDTLSYMGGDDGDDDE